MVQILSITLKENTQLDDVNSFVGYRMRLL